MQEDKNPVINSEHDPTAVTNSPNSHEPVSSELGEVVVKKSRKSRILKIGVVIFLILSLSAGAYFYFGKQSLTILGDGAPCSSIPKKDKLEPLVSCEVEEIDGVRLVTVTSGEGMDCPSGCIYDYNYYVIEKNGDLYRVPRQPKYSNDGSGAGILEYGCNVIKPVKQYLDKRQGQYYWVDEFQDSSAIQELGYTCSVSGSILYGFQQEDKDYPKVYYDGLKIDYRDVPTGCNNLKYDVHENPFIIETKKNSCFGQLAIVNKEAKYCEQITKLYESARDEDRCYISVAIAKEDIGVCDQISVKDSNDEFEPNVKKCVDEVNTFKADLAFAKTLD